MDTLLRQRLRKELRQAPKAEQNVAEKPKTGEERRLRRMGRKKGKVTAPGGSDEEGSVKQAHFDSSHFWAI